MSQAAVLLCAGCELGSALDLAALTRLCADYPGVGSAQTVPCLCDAAGARALRDCARAAPSTIVLGACSARFTPLPTADVTCPVERVPLRELVVYSHEPGHAETQALAADTLRMGLIRALRSTPAVPQGFEVERCVLVVGGGATGIAAALVAAKAGYRVALVEREPALGGWLRLTRRLPPSVPPYRELEDSPLETLLAELGAEPLVTVHKGTTVERITGEPGRFTVTLRTPTGPHELRAGAVVQATGYVPYDATRLAHLGYGKSPDVVTSQELEPMLAEGRLRRPSDGQRARRIAFLLCAGSRDPDHLPYCSTVCCRTALKQALWARELDGDCEAYVVARDLRTPGLHEAFYRRAQEDPLLFFTKGEVSAVALTREGRLSVAVKGGLLGDDVALEAELVVLAVGMVPRASDNDALRELADARAALARGDPGQIAAEETVRRLEVIADSGTLGLGYRQGPDLPLDRYGFPDSHFICFPYETRRTGIYAAGAVRAPNDLEACRIDGEGAALKAIQAIEHAAAGLALHPRWGDPAPPSFNLQRCTQCKRCTEECPFGTLDEDERGTPKLHPTRCRRCGICLGACPERIISFPDYGIDVVSNLVKSVPIPDEFEESPRILVLACENDAYPALELAGFHRHRYSAYVRVIPVRCLGSVNVIWIADAMARGYDGVLLLGCVPGDDTQCHYLRGSELMTTRSENVKQKLTQLALEDERVRIEYVTITDYSTLGGRIDAFVQRIQEIGLNPFKDV